MTETKKSEGFFKKLLNKYSEFCKDLGVDNGACRSCTPIVKADEDGNLIKDVPKEKK
ncbi:DUF5363 domain-containing protein [Actinobacillus porcinus]|uniref:DUF5363 domain-containing protein n=1 Tax=Actinobacillus porcinus TaxID=51048 RepID=A0ABY6TLD0_9PAST|nr:DUF5363 domain-containing protein [Actinobacillus porcinus]MCI5764345.1 DUF5363 domain-containing protein [Actinobacillus porcinus]MDY5421514.1 DUF5363 domain-containing protein [Actinobacillus porcinus]MDY5848464.1 DUF5363 domain-containing protein [Actinobacillus porcinus]VFY93728.1 Uncharacterised protein [Actinobacillus porcinus]VTU09037.1 Uncharacterised protein [Actinobacillus porcinus]